MSKDEPRSNSIGGSNRSTSAWPLLVAVLLVNGPFVLGHPGWETVPPFLRSFAVNLVLFVIPGTACSCFLNRSKWSWMLSLLVVLSLSTVLFVGALGVFHSAGWPIHAGGIWNVLWLVSNGALLAGLLVRRRSTDSSTSPDVTWPVGCVLFAAAYTAYFVGATRVVPPQEDHDLEVQGTGWALLQRMEPLLLTDRGTDYYFAHPLLLHIYVAESFLFFGEADHLREFEAATQRNLAAGRGETASDPLDLPDGIPIIGRTGAHYLIQTNQGVIQVPVERVELEVIANHYFGDPHQLETRAPTIFLAALTVALLGMWTGRLAGSGWLGFLTAVAYASSPEVFVRSSYGGYFGISNFACLMLLVTAADWDEQPGGQTSRACFLSGLFAALANHKLALLPLVFGLYSLARPSGVGVSWRSRIHPSLVGFVVGTALFWLYGVAVNAGEFWQEHIRTHLVDRVAQINPLGYRGYPSVTELWLEFLRHSGTLLLPLGLCCLLALQYPSSPSISPPVSRTTLRQWLLWVVVTSVVFSVVDWRMTKHLMPLLLVFHLAPAAWAHQRPVVRLVAGGTFVGILVWNLSQAVQIATDFESFRITPAW